MKFSDLEGKTLSVVSARPWEILLEEEVGGMNGPKFILRPSEEHGQMGSSGIELFALKEERAKP